MDLTVEPNFPNKAASLKNLSPFNNLGSLMNLKKPDDWRPSGTIGKENITIISSILWDFINSYLLF